MPLWGLALLQALQAAGLSRAQVRRRRTNDLLLYRGQKLAGGRHVLAACKALARKPKRVCAARLLPRRSSFRRAARSRVLDLGRATEPRDLSAPPAARLQVVVARGCPPVGNERHARLLRLRQQQYRR